MPGRHLRAVQLRGSRHALCTRCHPHCRDRRHRLGSLAAGPRTRRVDAGALRWVCVCGLHDGSSTSMAHERLASSSACYGLPVVLRRPVCCALDGRSEAACAKHGHFFNQTLYCIHTVFTLPLGSGSAAQQPSYPCEAYAEQAQRKLPLHLQATVMGCAALVAC